MTLYDELAAYTGRPLDLVRLRSQYAAYELAWQWNNRKDKIPEFYSESDLYLYDLTEYQTRLHGAGWHQWLSSVIKHHSVKSVLDFGGGIGEASITSYKAGAERIDFIEITKSPQAQYAISRFIGNEMCGRIRTFNSLKFVQDTAYDLVIAMDVLEHLQSPRTELEYFQRVSPRLICNADDLPYGLLYPQHISHPDPGEFYTKAEGNLWLRKGIQ